MAFVMEERVKHRLTGLLVILSVALICFPAMMKKSNQRIEEKVSVSLKLPNKPLPPRVAMPNPQTLFQEVKVAHVDLPVEQPSAPPLPSKIAAIPPLPGIVSRATPAPIAVVKPDLKLIAAKKTVYAVQLASFSQQKNAQQLVERLRAQGFVASYAKRSNQQGPFYQVLVGQLNQRDDALHLQKKLVSRLRLNGFVVKTALG